jgi:hypothetical protein
MIHKVVFENSTHHNSKSIFYFPKGIICFHHSNNKDSLESFNVFSSLPVIDPAMNPSLSM